MPGEGVDNLELTWLSFDRPFDQSADGAVTPKLRKGRVPPGDSGSAGVSSIIRKQLYSILVSDMDLDKILDVWILEYNSHKEVAFLMLIQSFLSFSGSKSELTVDMLETMEYKEIVRTLADAYDVDLYPFAGNRQKDKNKRIIANFFSTLVKKCRNNYLFDQYLFVKLTDFLLAMSEDRFRFFRRIACFAMAKIHAALLIVEKQMEQIRESYLKNIATFLDSSSQRNNGTRLSVLNCKRNLVEERLVVLKKMMGKLFKEVFASRYRDADEEIREFCIDELAALMLSRPDRFLKDDCLKYLAWSLYDKAANVRSSCVWALVSLYSEPDFIARLRYFASRYKDVLVSMVYDKNGGIAVWACGLLCDFARNFDGLLESKDIDKACELVFCNNRDLAVAAGNFLMIQLEKTDISDEESRGFNSEFGEDSKLLIRLARFYHLNEHRGRADLLVDALMDKQPVLKKWGLMATLAHKYKVKEIASSMLEILTRSVAQWVSGSRPLRSRLDSRRASVRNPRDNEEVDAQPLIRFIPSLIRQYGTDTESLVRISSIIYHLRILYPKGSSSNKRLSRLLSSLGHGIEEDKKEAFLDAIPTAFRHLMEIMPRGSTKIAKTPVVTCVRESVDSDVMAKD